MGEQSPARLKSENEDLRTALVEGCIPPPGVQLPKRQPLRTRYPSSDRVRLAEEGADLRGDPPGLVLLDEMLRRFQNDRAMVRKRPLETLAVGGAKCRVLRAPDDQRAPTAIPIFLSFFISSSFRK